MTWRTAISISIWVNYHDLASFSLTIIKVSKENHPKMAARFRLVKLLQFTQISKTPPEFGKILSIFRKKQREREREGKNKSPCQFPLLNAMT